MRIRDDRPSVKPRSIQLSAIPLGQIFKGSVYGNVSRCWTDGVFYKANEGIGGTYTANGQDYDLAVVVVRLDHAGRQTFPTGTYANLWLRDAEVRNYEPVNAELVIS